MQQLNMRIGINDYRLTVLVESRDMKVYSLLEDKDDSHYNSTAPSLHFISNVEKTYNKPLYTLSKIYAFPDRHHICLSCAELIFES